MFNGYSNAKELIQNLYDVDCDEDMIACILSCFQRGDKSASLVLLEKQRSLILGNIHAEQASIEYLDKLVCELKGQAI